MPPSMMVTVAIPLGFPISAKPPVTNTNLLPGIWEYAIDELDIFNKQVDLNNNQRLPIEIDFSITLKRSLSLVLDK